MQYHSVIFCLFMLLTSTYAILLPLSSGPNLTDLDQPGIALSTGNSSLTSQNASIVQESDSDLYDWIAGGIKAFHDQYSRSYQTCQLYKIIVSASGPTTDIGALRNVVMNFLLDDPKSQAQYVKWYYHYQSREWVLHYDSHAWSDDAEFRASNPIYTLSRPIDIGSAIKDMKRAPAGTIPDSQLNGPWRTISIVNYKQPPLTKIMYELTFRFEAQRGDGGLDGYYRSLDVLVGQKSGIAVRVPAEYDFQIPEPNAWGWGQDNRLSPSVIGPFTYFDYLMKGVNLVMKTMGDGYYRDAQLVQVKIENPMFSSKEEERAQIQPQHYNVFTLFFKWHDTKDRGLQKWIQYTVGQTYELDDMVEAGNKWATWERNTTVYGWQKLPPDLNWLNAADPRQYLDTIDVSSLGMSILSAFAVREKEYDSGGKQWTVADHLYLCKPNYHIDPLDNGEMIYYFPSRPFLLGTQSGKAVEVKDLGFASNLTVS